MSGCVGNVGSESKKPTLAVGCAWVLELKVEKFCFRLEQTDTGATAQHGTTHAATGGGMEGLLHQVLRLKVLAAGVKANFTI
jgi:hypothetical protein